MEENPNSDTVTLYHLTGLWASCVLTVNMAKSLHSVHRLVLLPSFTYLTVAPIYFDSHRLCKQLPSLHLRLVQLSPCRLKLVLCKVLWHDFKAMQCWIIWSMTDQTNTVATASATLRGIPDWCQHGCDPRAIFCRLQCSKHVVCHLERWRDLPVPDCAVTKQFCFVVLCLCKRNSYVNLTFILGSGTCILKIPSYWYVIACGLDPCRLLVWYWLWHNWSWFLPLEAERHAMVRTNQDMSTKLKQNTAPMLCPQMVSIFIWVQQNHTNLELRLTKFQ